MYTQKVIEHYTKPRNVGQLEEPDGIGEAGEMKCGDYMIIHIRVNNDIIQDIKFQVYGCGAAIASSSMTTELAKGKHVLAAYTITSQDIVNALGGLPIEKVHCSVLGERALKNAITHYAKKKTNQ